MKYNRKNEERLSCRGWHLQKALGMGAKGVITERGQHGVRMFHRVYCRVQMQRGSNKNPNTSLTRAWDTWGVSALVTGGSAGRERDAPT